MEPGPLQEVGAEGVTSSWNLGSRRSACKYGAYNDTDRGPLTLQALMTPGRTNVSKLSRLGCSVAARAHARLRRRQTAN